MEQFHTIPIRSQSRAQNWLRNAGSISIIRTLHTRVDLVLKNQTDTEKNTFMNIEIRVATAAEKTPVYRMLELYQHDLSDIWDQDLDEHGEFGFFIDRFWTNPKNKAYVFLVNGKFAGCALVDRSVRMDENDLWMSQFFVMKKYRGTGVGKMAAHHIFDEMRGRWEVGQMTGNQAAERFWDKVITAYTGGNYVNHAFDHESFHGRIQCFDNTLQPA